MNSGIYGLIDPRNGELRYIGLSCDLKSRKKQHLKSSGKRGLHLKHWLNQLRKLDIKPEFHIIELCSTNQLKENEIFWIEYFKSLGCKLTNLTLGGEGILGYRFSEAQKQDISAKTKIGMTAEVRARLSIAKKGYVPHNKGKSLSEERKLQISKFHTGRKQSKETIEKRRQKLIGLAGGMLGKVQSITSRQKIADNSPFRIKVVDQSGNIYPSIRAAAKAIGVHSSEISRILQGQAQIRKGYSFRKL